MNANNGTIGPLALYLLFIWLVSAAGASWLTEEPPKTEETARDRNDAVRLLTRARPLDAEELNQVIAESVSGDGAITTPLVAVGGDLAFPFDELEAQRFALSRG